MNSRVLKHIFHLLEAETFPHVLRWHNREEREFEVVFVHKKSPKWNSSCMDLAKELDKMSNGKCERYSQQENYCTKSKGRVRANLDKLVKNKYLLFKGKIAVDKSIIKKIYKLNVSVMCVTHLQATPVKKKRKQCGKKNVSVDVFQDAALICPDLSPFSSSMNLGNRATKVDFQNENFQNPQLLSPDLSPYHSHVEKNISIGNNQDSTVSCPDLSPLSYIAACDEIDDFRAKFVSYNDALNDSCGLYKRDSISLDGDILMNAAEKFNPTLTIHLSVPENIGQSSFVLPATLHLPIFVEVKKPRDILAHACATCLGADGASLIDPQFLNQNKGCMYSENNYVNPCDFSRTDENNEASSPISCVENTEIENDANLDSTADWKRYINNDLGTKYISMYESSEKTTYEKQAPNIDVGNFEYNIEDIRKWTQNMNSLLDGEEDSFEFH